eukprot:2742977-Rhodomonas_salina.1
MKSLDSVQSPSWNSNVAPAARRPEVVGKNPRGPVIPLPGLRRAVSLQADPKCAVLACQVPVGSEIVERGLLVLRQHARQRAAPLSARSLCIFVVQIHLFDAQPALPVRLQLPVARRVRQSEHLVRWLRILGADG